MIPLPYQAIEPPPDQVIDSLPDQVIKHLPDQVIEHLPDQVIEPPPDQVIEPLPDQVISNCSLDNLDIILLHDQVASPSHTGDSEGAPDHVLFDNRQDDINNMNYIMHTNLQYPHQCTQPPHRNHHQQHTTCYG